MSLILDALRKSEAERRRGQVPELHAERAPAVEPAREGPPIWVWMTMTLAAAVVLALVLWLVRGTLTVPRGDTDQTGGTRARIDAIAENPAQPTLADSAAPSTAPDGSSTAPSRPGASVTKPLTRTEPVSTPRQSSDDDTASLAIPTPDDALPSTAPRVDTIDTDRAAPAASATTGPAQEIAAAVATVPIPAPTPAAPAPTSAVPDAGMSQPATSMRLSDLSVSQREKLPPLRMSMHLWAPTQRFAIIDGARVTEGDRVGDAVVEEVTADGVVLAWQGLRLHIPVR